VPSSERLFSALAYVIFAAPAAVVLIWMVWRFTAWVGFWIRALVFPGRVPKQGEGPPRLFAQSSSRALSYVFVFCLVVPVAFVPLRYLAGRVEGPQISFWHWLVVFGPILLAIVWLVSAIRRLKD